MKHIFLIDPIELLNIKKDSSLHLALTMQSLAKEMNVQQFSAYLLFKNDFYLLNHHQFQLSGFEFSGEFDQDFYIENFSLGQKVKFKLEQQDTIHFRLDPPFDEVYSRILWMLRMMEENGVKVLNSPAGILKNNEKILAYQCENSLPSYIGSNIEGALSFRDELLKMKTEFVIFKPMDMFQGMGVRKVSIELDDYTQAFNESLVTFKQMFIIQPFNEQVKNGEIRAVYFMGEHVGSILKVPAANDFMANIARGASFRSYDLSTKLEIQLREYSQNLMQEGINWIAFDVMGEYISEVNITCPGLMVELCKAHKKNLSRVLAKKLLSTL